jgi:hypothetical protein
MKQTIAIAMMLAAALFLGGLQTAQAQTTYTAGAALVADETGDRGNDVEAKTSDDLWSFGTKTSSITGWTIMPSTWHVDSFGFGTFLATADDAFAGWSEDNCQTGNADCVPLIAVNTTDVNQGWVGGTTFAPATFWVHPNNTVPGPCVAVRWTAPFDGTADVSAEWQGKYNGCGDGVTTHVTINDVLLSGSKPDGAYPPLNTPLVYTSNGVEVSAGDNIDFTTCPNASYICDSTQFDAMVTFTPTIYSCEGFEPPLDTVAIQAKNNKRVLPFKATLVDG